MGLHWKELARTGFFQSLTAPIEITRSRLAHWSAMHAAMRRAGLLVPITWEHQDLGPARMSSEFDPMADAIRRAEKVRLTAGTVVDTRLARDPATGEWLLFGLLDVPRADDSGRLGATVHYCSPEIDPEFRDGLGKVWRDVVTHVALVNVPVNHLQVPFAPPADPDDLGPVSDPARFGLRRAVSFREPKRRVDYGTGAARRRPGLAIKTLPLRRQPGKKYPTGKTAARGMPYRRPKLRGPSHKTAIRRTPLSKLTDYSPLSVANNAKSRSRAIMRFSLVTSTDDLLMAGKSAKMSLREKKGNVMPKQAEISPEEMDAFRKVLLDNGLDPSDFEDLDNAAAEADAEADADDAAGADAAGADAAEADADADAEADADAAAGADAADDDDDVADDDADAAAATAALAKANKGVNLADAGVISRIKELHDELAAHGLPVDRSASIPDLLGQLLVALKTKRLANKPPSLGPPAGAASESPATYSVSMSLENKLNHYARRDLVSRLDKLLATGRVNNAIYADLAKRLEGFVYRMGLDGEHRPGRIEVELEAYERLPAGPDFAGGQAPPPGGRSVAADKGASDAIRSEVRMSLRRAESLAAQVSAVADEDADKVARWYLAGRPTDSDGSPLLD